MPALRFFRHAGRIARLQAAEDLRLLNVMRAAQADAKGFKAYAADLQAAAGGSTGRRPAGRRRAGNLALGLAAEAREHNLLRGSVQVVEPGTLRAEIEARKARHGSGD